MFRENASIAEVIHTPVTEAPPPAIIRPEWWDREDLTNNYENRCRDVVKRFMLGQLIEGEPMKHTNMNGRHIYSTKNNGTELWMFKNNQSIKVKVCVARKANGMFIGNASSLMFAKPPPTKKSPNPRVRAVGGTQLKIQQVLSEAMPMVPFGLFKETMLDINTLHIIEKGPDEQLELGRKVRDKEVLTHYTGALLFKIEFMKRSKSMRDHRNEGQYFLFDIDRNDLKLKNLNFFLSRLAGPAKSITEAYDLLKPKEVLEAERFLGRKCERQGEWFFIPVQGRFKRQRDQTNWNGSVRRGRPRFVEAVLQSKGNRAHYVKFLSEQGYVTGKVWHGGHEHKPISLPGWHKPVPNTAVESFKISGAVD